MDWFDKEAAKIAMHELLNGKHFDIVGLRSVGRLLGVDVERHQRFQSLRALHCVDYADMPDDVRQAIPQMVVEVLRQDTVDAGVVLAAVQAEGNNWTPGVEDESNVKRLRHG